LFYDQKKIKASGIYRGHRHRPDCRVLHPDLCDSGLQDTIRIDEADPSDRRSHPVNKFIYGIKVPHFRNTLISIKEPKKGDIVVFIYPEDRTKDFIKRVIATSGDTVEIRNKKIYLMADSMRKVTVFIPTSLSSPALFSPGTISDLSPSLLHPSLSWGTTETRAMTAVSGDLSISRTSWEKPSSFTGHGIAKITVCAGTALEISSIKSQSRKSPRKLSGGFTGERPQPWPETA
jgi:hypothetical protein